MSDPVNVKFAFISLGALPASLAMSAPSDAQLERADTVTRLVTYWDWDRALTDFGMEE
jgi:hypothetical protein